MTARAAVDPQLHTIRTCVQSFEGRERSQAESARFALFSAFERGDSAEARLWARALRVALLAANAREQLPLVTFALDALGEIDAAIEAST